MFTLPTEKKEKVAKAMEEFNANKRLTIWEPCNCGSQIRHNNGGNYHQIIEIRRDGNKNYVKFDSTCELVADAEWQLLSKHYHNVRSLVLRYADWL